MEYLFDSFKMIVQILYVTLLFLALSYFPFSFEVTHIISFDRYFENVSFGANVVTKVGSLNIDLPNAIYFWGRCTYELVPKYDPSQIGLKMFFGALRPHSFALSSFKGLTLKIAIRRVLLRLMHKKIFKAICYFCLFKKMSEFHLHWRSPSDDLMNWAVKGKEQEKIMDWSICKIYYKLI